MDFSSLNKNNFGVYRVKSYQIAKKNTNNNLSRRIDSAKSELKYIEQIETHYPISPSSNHTFKSYLSKKKKYINKTSISRYKKSNQNYKYKFNK